MKQALSLAALIGGMILCPTPSSAKTATLHIDANVRHQKVTGFGGFAFAATWGDNLTDADVTTLFSCDNTNKTLGYNILRARIAPDSTASWGQDIWKVTIDRMKKARTAAESSNRKFYSFASAWTPPGKFTSNGENTHGSILRSSYADYTAFLNRFIARCEEAGTDVDYISLQNEPDYEVDYEGCWWWASDFIAYYANYASSLNRPTIGPESLAMRWALSDSILNNEAACNGLGILGGHLYGGGNFDYPLARQKGKDKWMTEFLINASDMGYSSDHNYTWSDAIYFGRVVNTSMLANYNAWVHYAIKSSYGLIGDGNNGTTEDVVTKRGYVLAHFAKYVSGTTRIHTVLRDPSHSGLSASAYLTASEDTCVVMVLNPSTTKTDLTLSLPFQAQKYRYYLTNLSNNLVGKNVTLADMTADPTITVAPASVNTYLFIKAAERTDEQEAIEQPLWADSLQLYCGECVHPKGWNVTVNGTVRTSTNGNSFWNGSQTRLLPYSPESPIPAGILLHATSSSSSGIATYGSNSAYRLNLPEGRYRMIWHSTGYNGIQQVQSYVTKLYGTTKLANHTVTTAGSVNGRWGSGIDCLDAVADTMDFTVTSAGNHVLTFKVVYNSGAAVNGSCMALVGGISIEQLDDEDASGIENVTRQSSLEEDSPSYIDLYGRRVDTLRSGTFYVRPDGSKVHIGRQ